VGRQKPQLFCEVQPPQVVALLQESAGGAPGVAQ